MDIKDLTFDPTRDDILGVFGDVVHVKVHDFPYKPVVLLIPREEYIRVWNNYLEGKKNICEQYGSHCGVMGYTTIEDGEDTGEFMSVLEWNDNTNDCDVVSAHVVSVVKFYDEHDFEHG